MAGLCAPLSTLRRGPRGHLRMTRGRCGSPAWEQIRHRHRSTFPHSSISEKTRVSLRLSQTLRNPCVRKFSRRAREALALSRRALATARGSAEPEAIEALSGVVVGSATLGSDLMRARRIAHQSDVMEVNLSVPAKTVPETATRSEVLPDLPTVGKTHQARARNAHRTRSHCKVQRHGKPEAGVPISCFNKCTIMARRVGLCPCEVSSFFKAREKTLFA
jgi:hypothetical protein